MLPGACRVRVRSQDGLVRCARKRFGIERLAERFRVCLVCKRVICIEERVCSEFKRICRLGVGCKLGGKRECVGCVQERQRFGGSSRWGVSRVQEVRGRLRGGV